MTLSPRYVDAVRYAAATHAKQLRKGTTVPYLSHLLGVSSIALEFGADEEEAIAALLHDAIEDHGPSHREPIREQFGERVLEIVLGCSDSEGEPKPPWRQRKEQYIAHLREANASIHLVSGSDKIHNLRAITRDYRLYGDPTWARFKGGQEGTLWYYRELAVALEKAPRALITELRATLDQLESLVKSH